MDIFPYTKKRIIDPPHHSFGNQESKRETELCLMGAEVACGYRFVSWAASHATAAARALMGYGSRIVESGRNYVSNFFRSNPSQTAARSNTSTSSFNSATNLCKNGGGNAFKGVSGGAYNRAAFEQYKTTLRVQMEKPYVVDPKLKKIIERNYRPHANIGNGSTAAAIRYEIATGGQVYGKLLSQKGRESIISLKN